MSEKEIALRKAQFRFKEAEDKVAAVRRWKRTLPQALNEYVLPPRRLAGFLDGDVQNALVVAGQQNRTSESLHGAGSPFGRPPRRRRPMTAVPRPSRRRAVMSLNAASVELADGMKTLNAVWEETRAVWTDGVATGV